MDVHCLDPTSSTPENGKNLCLLHISWIFMVVRTHVCRHELRLQCGWTDATLQHSNPSIGVPRGRFRTSAGHRLDVQPEAVVQCLVGEFPDLHDWHFEPCSCSLSDVSSRHYLGALLIPFAKRCDACDFCMGSAFGIVPQPVSGTAQPQSR